MAAAEQARAERLNKLAIALAHEIAPHDEQNVDLEKREVAKGRVEAMIADSRFAHRAELPVSSGKAVERRSLLEKRKTVLQDFAVLRALQTVYVRQFWARTLVGELVEGEGGEEALVNKLREVMKDERERGGQQ